MSSSRAFPTRVPRSSSIASVSLAVCAPSPGMTVTDAR